MIDIPATCANMFQKNNLIRGILPFRYPREMCE